MVGPIGALSNRRAESTAAAARTPLCSHLCHLCECTGRQDRRQDRWASAELLGGVVVEPRAHRAHLEGLDLVHALAAAPSGAHLPLAIFHPRVGMQVAAVWRALADAAEGAQVELVPGADRYAAKVAEALRAADAGR